MAQDVFAISPITASGKLPTDSDFDAISEAFMETARGRWFLKEYARRNRNADTALVLDAVARMEATLATGPQPPLPDISQFITTVRDIVADAKARVNVTLDRRDEDHLAPARRAARIVQEISWRLRETGSDGRICTLLDQQAAAMIAVCDQVVAHEPPRDAVVGEFDAIDRAVAAMADNSQPTPQRENVVSLALKTVTPVAEAASSPVAFDDAAVDALDVVSIDDESAVAPSAVDDVAINSDADEGDSISASAGNQAVHDAIARFDAELALAIERDAGTIAPAEETDPPPVTPNPPKELTTTPAERSLGTALIADGVINVKENARDPFAALRRMTQAERIAFFS